MSAMATLASPQKITFAEMRESGARGLLVYCAGKLGASFGAGEGSWSGNGTTFQSALEMQKP